MTRKILFFCSVLSALTLTLYFYSESKCFIDKDFEAFGKGDNDDPDARLHYEMRMLVDPATGKIPEHIFRDEQRFAQTLPNDLNSASKTVGGTVNWQFRGPNNVGGRTRALVADVTNENILIAASVSGGIYRSTDGGQSWKLSQSRGSYPGIVAIAQDIRPGKTNNWYAATGEAAGNSAGGNGSYYVGNGIYKSKDGGLSWDSLPSTASNTPHSFDSPFDAMWNIAIDPTSPDSTTILYAACVNGIYRSMNDGKSWTLINGGSPFTGRPYYSDVAISKSGVVYFTVSSDHSNPSAAGIWRGSSSSTFSRIVPIGFAFSYNRLKLAISPSDENQIWLLGNTPGGGKTTTNFASGTERNSLWKYTYLSGNGVGNSGGRWAMSFS